MSGANVSVGYMPLVDAAPVIIAHELGFAAQEGIKLELIKAPSWATLRDMLVHETVDAAHMLAPVPIAMALGLGPQADIEVLSVLSVNGTVVGVSSKLAERLRSSGYSFDFCDPKVAGRALMAQSDETLRIGVPFPFSMHSELLHYWLGALGITAQEAVQIKTVPPPLMAEAIAAGEIDAFCVGEPWGSIAVENGVGELLLPLSSIWAFAPEKVLVARKSFAKNDPALAARLTRALWRAGNWLDQRVNHMTASEILARPEYVNVSAEIIERAFEGQLTISPKGEIRKVENFIAFTKGAASFPWRSWSAWIAQQMAERLGLDRDSSVQKAEGLFRTDLYRSALEGEAADIPSASSKVEGSLSEAVAHDSVAGRLILERDTFFDGRVFDPDAIN